MNVDHYIDRMFTGGITVLFVGIVVMMALLLLFLLRYLIIYPRVLMVSIIIVATFYLVGTAVDNLP